MTWYPEYFYNGVFFLYFIYLVLYYSGSLVWSKKVLDTHKGAKGITKDYKIQYKMIIAIVNHKE